MRLIRWKAIIPLTLFLGLVTLVWLLYLDTFVEHRIENWGTEIVGALVELDEADVRLTEGMVRLRGLKVTNPDAPMTNLFEASEIVADLRVVPLLEKKIYIDTLAIREMRFGTPRETSGAIAQQSPTNRALRRQIDGWAERIRIPDFSLEGLGRAVNVTAIRPESLQTPAYARQLIGVADSSRRAWEATLASLNPQPVIDSGRAMLNRLQSASIPSLGLPGMVQTLRSARAFQTQIDSKRNEIAALDDRVRASVATLETSVDSLTALRTRDLAYARSLLRIPSISTPDLSPSIFGSFAVSKIKPLLYWAQTVERYLPAGLDPRRRPGPKRLRLAGDDIAFPSQGELPKFTLAFAEASLAIGGQGAAAGDYQGVLTGLTSAPALLGVPTRLSASRSNAATGPSDIDFHALLNHVGAVPRDSVDLRVVGIRLPSVSIAGLGATLDFGSGTSMVQFERTGPDVAGVLQWQASGVDWQRQANQSTGLQARVENLLWRTVSAVRDVNLEVRFSGNALGPSLGIRSNIGTAISQSLRQQLRAEIDSVETMVRAEVDRLVSEPIRQGRERVAAVKTEVQSVITTQRTAIEDVRTQLEARIRELTRLVG